MDEVFNLTVPKSDYKVSLNLLLLWINRFIIKDTDRHNSTFYGGKSDGDNYVIWFKDESDLKRAEWVLRDVRERGYPMSFFPY